MNKLSSMQYLGSGSIHGYIMKMTGIASQLNEMKFTISDNFIVHFILNSLPTEYSAFKVPYNTQKVKRLINDLISMCSRGRRNERRKSAQCTYSLSSIQGFTKR
ncbi:hypothetical protein AXF42_Ash013688 [Apostasia shenzhenica]|uniref:Retrovirus-related Pol polyprotein from transposon TNT 1-94 n=1 Tax=Apostasia shenzhenica TaxID=1088818 RepID=A0A2I0A4K7_9ASPA|nr:hypothetical protein AXF42_Ash013688 [Apostasia shenzhenica]